MINLQECEQIASELDLPAEKVLQVLDKVAEIASRKESTRADGFVERDIERMKIYKEDVEDAKGSRREIRQLITSQNQALDRIGVMLQKLLHGKL